MTRMNYCSSLKLYSYIINIGVLLIIYNIQSLYNKADIILIKYISMDISRIYIFKY